MDGIRTETLNTWTDYCAKSDELAMLILQSHSCFDDEIQDRIRDKRTEVDQILDAMIGEKCHKQAARSKRTGKTTCARDA